MLSFVRWLMAGCVCIWTLHAVAGESNATPTASGLPVASPDRFGRFEDSYVVRQQLRSNGWTASDEYALRAHYSFGYT